MAYQDNQIAVFMEGNGQASCTVNYHRIRIRSFFVKDRQYKGEFSIEYCPTWKIMDSYFTKPLQGLFFDISKEINMVWKHVDTCARKCHQYDENFIEVFTNTFIY